MATLIVLREQLNHLESALQLTDSQLARVVGTDPRTVQRWRTDETFP
jgi:DNA-binding transcriptional regulator YiaG